MVGRGGVLAYKPIEEIALQRAALAGRDFNLAGEREFHHVERASVGEHDRDDLAALNGPALSGQTNFRTVDAAFLAAAQHDLRRQRVAAEILVDFFGELRVAGKQG